MISCCYFYADLVHCIGVYCCCYLNKCIDADYLILNQPLLVSFTIGSTFIIAFSTQTNVFTITDFLSKCRILVDVILQTSDLFGKYGLY